MNCGGSADAALQGESHRSARKGDQGLGLRSERCFRKTVMIGRGRIRTIMTSQAHERE